MMSFKRALSIVKRAYPNNAFTGIAFKYGNKYYLELKSADSNKEPLDSMVSVDCTTASVKPYSPIIDGCIFPTDAELIDYTND